MPIQQLKVWAAEKGIGESNWTLEELGLYEEKGTTGKKANHVRESIFSIASSLGIRGNKEASKAEWDGMIKQCINSIHNLAGQRAQFCRWKVDPSANNFDGRKCKIAIDNLAEMAIRSRKGRLPVENTPKRKQKVESGTFCIVMITFSKLTKSDGDEDISPINRRRPVTPLYEEVFNYSIVYIDPVTAQKRDGDKNIQWQWPNKDDLSLFTVLTSVIKAMILAVVKTVNEGMPDPSRRIRESWGVKCELGNDEGL
jgi:hypothetical protein